MKSENVRTEDRNFADFLLAFIGVALIRKTVEVKQEALRSLSALLEIVTQKGNSSYEAFEATIKLPINWGMTQIGEKDGNSGANGTDQDRTTKENIMTILFCLGCPIIGIPFLALLVVGPLMDHMQS